MPWKAPFGKNTVAGWSHGKVPRTQRYLLWDPCDTYEPPQKSVLQMWPGFWRQQVLVPAAWSKDIFTIRDSSFRGNYLDTRTSFSERLRVIFKLSTYILRWKTEDNLIFLFAATLTKRDQYINHASLPTDQMATKTPRCYEKTGFFMNIAMSEMLIIQTIREKQEDQQMTMERLWRKRSSILWRQMGIMSTLNKYLFLFGFLVEFFSSLLLEIITLNYSYSLWISKIAYFFETGGQKRG